MAPPWSRIQFSSYPIQVAAGRGCPRAVHAAIIHIAGADMIATYSAYVAAAMHTSKNNDAENTHIERLI